MGDEEFKAILGRAIKSVMTEHVAKISLAEAWPELFSTWDRKRINEADITEMRRMVDNELLYGNGRVVPRGKVKIGGGKVQVI